MIGVVLGIPAIAIIALARTGTHTRDIWLLRREIAQLKAALAAQGIPLPTAPTAPPQAARPAAPHPAPVQAAPPQPAPAQTATAQQPPAPPPPQPAPAMATAASAPPVPPAAAKAPPKPPPRKITERNITSRWMVWVGGIALALGGVFLVRYSIEQGYLGPAVRVVLGVIASLAMLAAGEFARRHPGKVRVQADYIPPVVTGAGFLTLFASIYAAYGLYDLIPPIAAFALLAAVAVGAIVVSLLHGQVMALFGLIGAMAVPILVSTDEPQATPLFAYLGVVSLTLGGIARLRHWWIAAAATMATASLWVLLWLGAEPAAPQPAAVSVFTVFLAALPLWITAEATDRTRVPGALSLTFPEYLVWASGAAVAILVFTLVRCDLYGFLSLSALFGVAAVYLAAAWRVPAWHGLPVAAAVAALAVLATWHVPVLVDPYAADPVRAALNPVRQPAFETFNGVAGGLAALFAIAGFAALRLGRQAGFWSGLSAAMPVLILFISYWRWAEFRSDPGWAAIGLALAGLATFAAERRRLAPAALGAYATGAVAALSLALAMVLREAWLTAALSLQLPALAWIAVRLGLPFLRWVALALAAVVLARLLANPALLDYPLSGGPLAGWPILNWVLYGYGVPAAAFWWASRRFLVQKDGLTVKLLEAGAIAFFTLLVTFQIRHLFAGALDAPYTDLAETSVQTAAWLGIGYGLYIRRGLGDRKVLDVAAMVLRGVGLAHLVFIQVLFQNPLGQHEDVGALPIVNTLALAYLLPALFGALYAYSAAKRGDRITFHVAAIAALALTVLWLSLEVRHAFQGRFLDGYTVTNAEQYTYSAVWLLFGAALFAAGIRFRNKPLRIAALAIFALTVAKAFLYDMSEMTGLFRALSFLGLGAALLGVGYLYQRFVMQPEEAEEDGPLAGQPPGAPPPTAP
ncbi:MAG: DUF2339 domain-containing protein [Sphingomonadales bacterium]